MKIYTVNYHEKILEHPDLTKIMGVPKYETLHLLYNKIKANTMAFHSNLRGVKHGYLILLVSLTYYALLTNTPFFRQFRPGNLIIPIAATRHAQEELKRQYDENQRVFHETRGVEQALIQKLVFSVEAKYITAISNRTNGQFKCTIFILIQYLVVRYGKISPSQLIDLEQNTKSIQYGP